MATSESTISFRSSTLPGSTTVRSSTFNSTPGLERTRVPGQACEIQSGPVLSGSTVDLTARNLFPVVEAPRFIFSAETQFQLEEQVVEVCGGAGPLPFLLLDSRIFTLSPITPTCAVAAAVKVDREPHREPFVAWLSHEGRARYALELLNRFLRFHAWKRGLRFDETHGLNYFTRSKPKKLYWEIDGRISVREVTAPHMKSYLIDSRCQVEFQCGWKHEAVRAEFVNLEGSLFMRLDPTWFLTELDGKTSATRNRVVPEHFSRAKPSNAEMIRTLHFWSAVLSKGHRELRVETGANPIRVRLIPPTVSAPRIIPRRPANLDLPALEDLEEDFGIPELVPARD